MKINGFQKLTLLDFPEKMACIVFTAGVGENTPCVREAICENMQYLGLEIDKEKNIFRQTSLSGNGRKENDAEHAWHMAIMAWLLREYANESVDITKVMLMCLIHDIVEIDAGDAYAYDEEQLKTDLMSVVAKALEGYNAMRVTEGKALDADLRTRGNTILELVSQVEAGNSQTVIDYRTRLENKLKEVLANTAIDESRILTEAAIFADKVAVDEETVRLRSHLQQMNTMLTGGGAVGRKLDFLLQEMNREANTIGSKCTDVRLARIVVDIKAELEKIREQTQNIE